MSPPYISAAAALTLTDWSESTLRRRCAEGLLGRALEPGNAGRSMIPWKDLEPHVIVKFKPLDLDALWAADAGDPGSQVEMGILLAAQGLVRGARAWFQLAARDSHAGAAYWLARLALENPGTVNDTAALAWLAKAAEWGHPIAQAQIRELAGRPVSPSAGE